MDLNKRCDIYKKFDHYKNYLSEKYNIAIDAHLCSSLDFVKKVFISNRFSLQKLIQSYKVVNNNLGNYCYEDKSIYITLNHKISKVITIEEILHILTHEFRHRMQDDFRCNYSNLELFIYFMENFMCTYDKKFYKIYHDYLFVEYDANIFGINELLEYSKENHDLDSNFLKFLKECLNRNNILYDESFLFDRFATLLKRLAKDDINMWKYIDIVIKDYPRKDKEIIVEYLHKLFNYNGIFDIKYYEVLELDDGFKKMIFNSNVFLNLLREYNISDKVYDDIYTFYRNNTDIDKLKVERFVLKSRDYNDNKFAIKELLEWFEIKSRIKNNLINHNNDTIKGFY